MPDNEQRPLIVHIIYRLQVGGLENGVINLINHLPIERYRHAIICLQDFTDFRERIQRNDVEIVAMHKKPGQDFAMLKQLYDLFRIWRPAIVHTRNIGCLEAQLPAWLARVPCRIHGEHGWDVQDPHGQNKTYRWLRRLHAPLVQRFIPLSLELDEYLQSIGISTQKISRIYNGVDTKTFHPGSSQALPDGFAEPENIIIGTVGRMHGVKDQTNLTRAFIQLHNDHPEHAKHLRLVMIGDGPLRQECLKMLQTAGLSASAWLPGARNDIPEIMRALTIFVLPSIAEGISNTILESMATGLPVIATRVGGNPELVDENTSGLLVTAENAGALAQALGQYIKQPTLVKQHGEAGLKRIHNHFSLQAMLENYAGVYNALLKMKGFN